MDTIPIGARIREPLRHALGGGAVEWPSLTPDEVITLLQHGVAPLVYAVARVPELRSAAMHAAAAESMRLDDLRAVLAALAARGVEALLMKGTPLAYELYAAPEFRPRGDTDLLIAHESLDATRDAFLSLGFDERITSGDEHAVRQVTFLRRDAFGVDHAYDVHWNVANTPLFADALRFSELRERAVIVKAIGANALALAPVDALLLASIHRIAHHHDSDRVIWLVDIALLRDRFTRAEHEQFWRLAAERGVLGVCIRSVQLANEWCARAPQNGPEEFLSREEIERDEASRVYLDREMTYGRMLLTDLRALQWRSRLRRLWQLAVPPAAFMRQSFGDHSRLMLPWLYVYRGARGIGRLFRRART